MKPNTLELVNKMLKVARDKGLEYELDNALVDVAEQRLDMDMDEIEDALAPPPYGEYPVVYYP